MFLFSLNICAETVPKGYTISIKKRPSFSFMFTEAWSFLINRPNSVCSAFGGRFSSSRTSTKPLS
ncbi:MAG: hypothetical protein ABJM36_14905 [Algibacter sp.]|uniref:hypothetical protein n=1 Tax=Algibacter sp. TaxID=1872428 RepID=UPI0032989920